MDFSHELIMPNDDLPFKMFLFEGKDGNYHRASHWHRSVEIFALFEGSLTFFLGENEYPLSPGQFMLVNSNEVHSIASPTPNTTIVLQIPLSTFANYYTDDKFIYFSRSQKNQDETVMSLLQDMYHTYAAKPCGYELKVQGQFYLLVYHLVSRYRQLEVSPELIKNNRNLRKLSLIVSYMKEHYSQNLSLISLAEIFGYSPTYLSRMFRKYAGTTYKIYLQNLRLEYAVRDLTGSSLSISDIALRHGFASSKAFTFAFRQKYGILPSAYRRLKS